MKKIHKICTWLVEQSPLRHMFNTIRKAWKVEDDLLKGKWEKRKPIKEFMLESTDKSKDSTRDVIDEPPEED